MAKARSNDLRERVVDAVASGVSRRQAAARFRVSPASAVRWVTLKAGTGGIEQRPRGGRSRSPLERHSAWLLALNEAENDLTLAQIVRRLLDECGLTTTETSIRRFFNRHRITVKNTACQRADAAACPQRRRGWPKRAPPGRPASRILIRPGWSSSTRPEPTPRWSAAKAVSPEAGGRGAASRSATGRRRPSPPGCAATA